MEHRRSLRIPGFDYGQVGGYFITICTAGRAPLLAEVRRGNLRATNLGHVVSDCWTAIPAHFPHAVVDAFVVMPDHLHGIVFLGPKHPRPSPSLPGERFVPVSHPQFVSPSGTIGAIVRGFKIGVTKWARANTKIKEVWQRNYYEHIIRNERELERIRCYIRTNPTRWLERHGC